MTDIVPPSVRSRMMAGIRGKDTLPERLIRSGLHRMGFRFRLHPGNVPGRPDIVLPRYRAAIFVHGCFWHGHNCPLFKVPGDNREFWVRKIEGNRSRDAEVADLLRKAGWRQLTIWECAMKGAGKLDPDKLLQRCARWILGAKRTSTIRGRR
jgi:DNA mismatch endonuclease (patch repair protein)